MKRIALAAVLLLPLQTPARFEINGKVVSDTTGEAIAGAQVTLVAAPPGVTTGVGFAGGLVGTFITGTPPPPISPPAVPPVPPPQVPAVTATSDGRFSFRDLSAGTYRLTVAANGYVRQEYGQRSAYSQGTPITLIAGQTNGDLTVRLIPTGTVTGHVLDDLGRPAMDAPVQLVRVIYGPDGKRFQAMASGNANDRGEYRLYGLTPGRYYLGAGSGPGPQRRPGDAVNPNRVMTGYAVSFYPGVSDMGDASLIEVKSGVEVIADLHVVPNQTHRVTGRVVNPNSGQPPAAISVSLAYRNLNGGGSFSSGRNYDPATGEFDLQDVVPGDYILQASVQDPRPFQPAGNPADFAARQAALAAQPRAEFPIRVTKSDVNGVVLTLTTGTSIPGHVTIEGAASSSLQGAAGIRVSLRPMWNGLPNPSANPPNSSPIAADGSFSVGNIRDGEYSGTVSGVPPGAYVKKAEAGGQDILGGSFIFSSAAPAALEVVLGTNPARLEGTVTDSQSRPASAAQVVLIPAQRSRTDLYKTALTDANGHFAISGITPGEYKLFSWDTILPFAYFDPDFIRMYENQGQAMHIDERSSARADIKVIAVSTGLLSTR